MYVPILLVLAVESVIVYSSSPEKDGGFQIIKRQAASDDQFLYTPLVEQNQDLEIPGGKIAFIGQFPYQVSLQVDINTHICGGSIIGNQWILTSANCVYNEHRKIHAVVGTNNIKTGGDRYRIAKVIVHPEFKFEDKLNDIALLQSSLRMVFNSIIRNVYLPYSMIQNDGLNMALSGWRTTNSFLPDYLQYINVTNIPFETCKKLLPNYSLNNSTNLCTLSIAAQGTCNENIGGLLLYNNTQYGILSSNASCTSDKPNVYTSISAFRFWIYIMTGI